MRRELQVMWARFSAWRLGRQFRPGARLLSVMFLFLVVAAIASLALYKVRYYFTPE